ncbi:MAG: alkaline phosphatase family protein, partial [Candidatus Marinimicrobia bacterium]|nr:alkaline phosphatase family protein [Candidatus Neomarinimicrobiota bacterium]
MDFIVKLTCFICSVVALCGFLVAFVAIGCSKKNRVNSQPTVTPIVVFGVDGLEWNVMLPMLRAGRLPNFAKLMERGYYGKLATFVPT